MIMIRYVRLLVGLVLVMPLSAQAENWPARLIKAVVPYGAGSAADVVPRLVFDRLGAELGQTIVIENRAGAGGTLGSAMVAKASPTVTPFWPSHRPLRSRRPSIPISDSTSRKTSCR